MRKYSLGAALLDKDDPSKILGRTACPILSAAESDREGYVPNVVYTCGALAIGNELFIPYGLSDSAIVFATPPVPVLPRPMAYNHFCLNRPPGECRNFSFYSLHTVEFPALAGFTSRYRAFSLSV